MTPNYNHRALAAVEFSAVAIPNPGISLEQAKDLWQEANPQNKVLDFGDTIEPHLLVAKEKTKTVIYEVCPELCPPGFTKEMAVLHMKNSGMDVRGFGELSAAGNPTIIVVERSK